MYAQLPKMTLSPSPISIPYPTRNSQANHRKRTKNHVYDPKMESSGSVENDLPFNKTMPNLPFSIGSITPPPQRVVRFNKRQYGGGGEKVAWNDLMRVAVPDKNSGGLWAISQAATRYVDTGEALAITEPSGSGKLMLLDALAGRLGPNTRQQTGKIMTNGLHIEPPLEQTIYLVFELHCVYLITKIYMRLARLCRRARLYVRGYVENKNNKVGHLSLTT